MALFNTRLGKSLTCLVSATVLAGTLTISSGANAHGFGLGLGLGLAGGLAVDALASATQPAYGYGYGGYGYGYGDCYITHRRTFDSFGNEYIRRVRVCD